MGGHRNEQARERHRNLLKKQLSLLSIPIVEPPREQYNLENHFGWKVLQKCLLGEGTLPPYLVHCIYCDKPEVPTSAGGDRDKVMYVLYVRGDNGDMVPVDVKDTQTSLNQVIDNIIESGPPPLSSPPPESRTVSKKGKKKKKLKRSSEPRERRRVIGDFYYIPIEERVNMKYDVRPVTVQGDDAQGDVAGMGQNQSKKGSKGRTKPKGWQLRAGAEYPYDTEDRTDTDSSSEGEEEGLEEEEEEEEDNEKECENKFIENLKDCDCFSKSNKVELMETTSEKNKYLYLPKERYERRHHNIINQRVISDFPQNSKS